LDVTYEVWQGETKSLAALVQQYTAKHRVRVPVMAIDPAYPFLQASEINKAIRAIRDGKTVFCAKLGTRWVDPKQLQTEACYIDQPVLYGTGGKPDVVRIELGNAALLKVSDQSVAQALYVLATTVGSV
jgi:hypothetical protein